MLPGKDGQHPAAEIAGIFFPRTLPSHSKGKASRTAAIYGISAVIEDREKVNGMILDVLESMYGQ